MASPLVGRPPACIACVRRITSAQMGRVSAGMTQVQAQVQVQVRGKKTSGRLKDQGVVIRLLKDVPQFGKQGSIFRTDRGRMRNHFFPNRKAEYMTEARFGELGLTKADIGERDFTFRIETGDGSANIQDIVEHVASSGAYSAAPALGADPPPSATPAVQIEQIAPHRALQLLTSMIPEVLTFERHLVHVTADSKKLAAETSSTATAADPAKADAGARELAPESEKPKEILSPLQQARRAKKQAEAEKEKEAAAAVSEPEQPEKKTAEELAKEREQREKEAEELLRIHGSVSLQHIASALKDMMLLDPEASRIHVQAEDITFVGLGEGVDKVEKIGTFEVEIRTHVGKSKVAPVRKKIEVVPSYKGAPLRG